jgi:hypothetical protein
MARPVGRISITLKRIDSVENDRISGVKQASHGQTAMLHGIFTVTTMADASGSLIDDIAYLVRSEHRVTTLIDLTVRPRSRSELWEAAGVSSSTIRRTPGVRGAGLDSAVTITSTRRRTSGRSSRPRWRT